MAILYFLKPVVHHGIYVLSCLNRSIVFMNKMHTEKYQTYLALSRHKPRNQTLKLLYFWLLES